MKISRFRKKFDEKLLGKLIGAFDKNMEEAYFHYTPQPISLYNEMRKNRLPGFD